MTSLASPWAVRLRSLARSLGLTRIAGALIGRLGVAGRRARAEYRRDRPATARLDLGGGEILLATENEKQYVQALAFERDRALVAALIRHLDDGACFWDVGANVGAYSCALGKVLLDRGGQVVAVEPDPWCGERLLANLALNGLDNSTVHRLALSDVEGEMHFARDPKATTGGHLVAAERADSQDLIRVAAMTGDKALEKWALPVPAVIKIDTEGYEQEVVSGLRATLARPRCRFVLVEVHFSLLEQRGMNDAPARVEAMLREAGFARLRWLDASHLAASKPGLAIDDDSLRSGSPIDSEG